MGKFLTNLSGPDGIIITGYTGSEEEIIIPKEIDGRTVFCLDDRCFAGNKTVKRIVIPDTVNDIGERAFAECEALEKVIFPKGITNLGRDLFVDSSSMKEIWLDSEPFNISGTIFSEGNVGFLVKMPKRCEKDDNWLFDMMSGIYIFGDPRNHIIPGYDKEYDPEGKKVKKAPNGLYYFERKGGIVITHGEESYDYGKEELIIPESIDGLPVVAIGTEAFKNASFLYLELPKTIKVISALAFQYAYFDYLKLPEKLDYLNHYWVGNADIFGSAINSALGLRHGETIIDYAYFVIMPKDIKELDANSLNENGCKLIFPIAATYEVTEKAVKSDAIAYDPKSHVVYKKENGYLTLLSSSTAEKVDDLPKSINGVAVKGWDSSIIYNLTKQVSKIKESFVKDSVKEVENEDGEKELELNFDEDNFSVGDLLEFYTLNETLEIPQNIRYIYDYLDKKVQYNKNSKIIFNNSIEVLEGVNASEEAFHVPSSVKKVDKSVGLLYADVGSSIEPLESDELTIITGVEKVEENSDYQYLVLTDSICIVKYIGTGDKAILPEKIDGLPVTKGIIKYTENVNTFVLDNPYFDTEEEKIKISFEKRLALMVIGPSLKKISTLSKLVPGYDYPKRIEISEGVEEIVGKTEKDFISFTREEPEDEEYKNTVILPRSLTHVGRKGLCDLNICYVEAYENTIFDNESYEEFAVLTIKNSDGTISKNVGSSIGGSLVNEFVVGEEEEEEQPYSYSNIINEVLRYDTSTASPTTMSKAREVLRSNGFYDLKVESDHLSIKYQGTSASPYLITITHFGGKLDFNCTCPSFYKGYRGMKCKHIYAFILYIKEKFGNDAQYSSNKASSYNSYSPGPTISTPNKAPSAAAINASANRSPSTTSTTSIHSSSTYKKRSRYNSSSGLAQAATILCSLAMLGIVIGIISSYMAKAEILNYLIYEHHPTGSGLVTTLKLGSQYGFFYVLMFLGAIGCGIAGVVMKGKRFITIAISAVATLIALIIISAVGGKFVFNNGVKSYYSESNFERVAISGTTTASLGVAKFFYSISLIMLVASTIISIIDYKKNY